MATKTISLRLDAYERLRRARLHPSESFSDVVMRARWAESTTTGAQLLARVGERGALYSAEELDAVADLKRDASPPTDKWSKP